MSKFIVSVIVAVFSLSGLGFAQSSIELSNLRCELLTNPLGIDSKEPRLSWEIQGSQRGIIQEAFHIMVASSKENLDANNADVWDSGKVDSKSSIQVNYNGKPLKSRQPYFWKVKVWTNKGETEWKEGNWTMGLMNYVDWRGRWIGLDRAFPWDREDQFSRLSARYFRKEFEVKKEIKNATVYVIGLGLYELFVNGQRIGNQVLAPAPTDYHKSVKYNTFDVTEDLKSGVNAIGTILGNGRYYTMRQSYKPYKIKTFGYPKMRLNLEVEYVDGTKEYINTDNTWKVTADGPIRTNNEYDGEEYDATKEMPGWNEKDFDDSKWLLAEFVQEPGGMPVAQMNEHMEVMQTLKPVSLVKLSDSVHIIDMGQNMTGWIKLHVNGNRGDAVKMRFAESLQDNGEIFTANLRDAKVTDIYTLKGGGQESWEPIFVYHGFRYVEVTNFPGTPTLESFEGKVVYDAIKTIGSFKTSNNTINQVYQNAFWGISGNYKGMPVDCPQRNERQPWLGDRTTGAYGESFIFDNSKLYSKWMDDIQEAQQADGSIPDVAPAFWRYYGDNMTWPGAYLAIADMLYNQFGDVRTIEKHYGSMKKWMDYMRDKYMIDYIVTKDKYGDWCVPPESLELIHSRDPARQTDGELLATATYYRLLGLMQGFAELTNNKEDISEYKELGVKVKQAFNDKFLNKSTGGYSNNTVTANLLPLSFNMVPEEYKEKVFENIVNKTMKDNNGHISTGVIGTQWLMRGFSNFNRPDIAYKIASNRTYPSWGYMAENGATTIWELWNGNTANPGMNSQNHVMLLGDLIIWYYENLLAIKSNKPGFESILMKPELIDDLDFVEGSYQSLYGEIGSKWTRKGKNFNWEITIPVNTTAEVHIPAQSSNHVTENRKKIESKDGIKFIKMENGRAVYILGSGNYKFNSKF